LVYINAISSYLPEDTLSNETIIKEYLSYGGEDQSISPESLFVQCGVKNRHVCPLDDTAKDLGNHAAKKLFNEWDIDKSNIDYIIFVSDALEYKGPTTACIMQHDLGLNNEIGAIDILHGCTGWIYGLSLAKALLIAKQATNVLVVTADVPTKVVHPIDIEIRAIFSDGAAATLLSNVPLKNGFNAEIHDFTLGTDGAGAKNLWVERSSTREPADIEWLEPHKELPTKLGGGRLRMSSPKIFMFALRKVPELIIKTLEKHQLEKKDIDYYILHQANGTMLDFLRKRLKLPKEKFIISIENTGNTVSASIPLATKELIDKNVFKKGNTILVAGFGIGYSWGATILTI
jgi:3-oxoacyl-[acyl-carrier-protein] synthase-3